MIEKHSASQSSALSDLQSELKSLKTLLLSRQNITQPLNSSAGTGTGSSTPNGNGSTTTTTTTTSAANALLGSGKGGRSIPAWQMAATPSRSETGSEAGSLSGSGILESEGKGKGKEGEKEA
jgi:peroxin-14